MLNETQNILDRLAAADREHQKEAGVRLLLRSVKYALRGRPRRVRPRCRSPSQRRLAAGAVAGDDCRRSRACHGQLVCRLCPAKPDRTHRPLSGNPRPGARLAPDQSAPVGRTNATTTRSRRSPANWRGRRWKITPPKCGGCRIESLARTDELAPPLQARRVGVAGFCGRAGGCVPHHAPSKSPALPIRLAIIRRIRSRVWKLFQPGPAGTNVIYGKGLVIRVKATGHQPKEVFLTAFPPGHPEQAVTLPMFDKGSRRL